jgi:hypothetical protein
MDMEDLVPLLIFIVIAAINFLKYLAEKGGKKKSAPEGGPADQEPRSIEDFFEEIERKFQPQPHELPEWPEEAARPDYLQEMEAYEAAAETAPSPAPAMEPVIEMPAVSPAAATTAPARKAVSQPKNIGKVTTFKMPAQGAVFSGLNSMRITMPPLLRSEVGRTRFELNSKRQLKQSLIASMVFGQPRAYDNSFATTLAK